MITFRQATTDDLLFLAEGFHQAMLMEDTPAERIQLFADAVCSQKGVLYSPENTTIVEVDGTPAGMITAYDGKDYRKMRALTMALVKQHMGIEFPEMEDETCAGEYYLDSLVVVEQYRGQGLGTALLRHAIAEGKRRGLTVTLAVDPVNETAQKLYRTLGFVPQRDIFIFGHTYHKWMIE